MKKIDFMELRGTSAATGEVIVRTPKDQQFMLVDLDISKLNEVEEDNITITVIGDGIDGSVNYREGLKFDLETRHLAVPSVIVGKGQRLQIKSRDKIGVYATAITEIDSYVNNAGVLKNLNVHYKNLRKDQLFSVYTCDYPLAVYTSLELFTNIVVDPTGLNRLSIDLEIHVVDSNEEVSTRTLVGRRTLTSTDTNAFISGLTLQKDESVVVKYLGVRVNEGPIQDNFLPDRNAFTIGVCGIEMTSLTVLDK